MDILHQFMKGKTFKCGICFATFAENSTLKSHYTVIHEGKKPYKCEICDVKFEKENELNEHVTSVHEKKKSFQMFFL